MQHDEGDGSVQHEEARSDDVSVRFTSALEYNEEVRLLVPR